MSDEGARAGAEEQQHSFDEILARLQDVVERLEGEELGLEQSIRTFEQGMELARRGQRILDEAERRVELLLQDGQTEPLDG